MTQQLLDIDIQSIALGHLADAPIVGGLLHELTATYGLSSRVGTLFVEVTKDKTLQLRFEARGSKLDLPLLHKLQQRHEEDKQPVFKLGIVGVDTPHDPMTEPRWLHLGSDAELAAHRQRTKDFLHLLDREIARRESGV